MCALYQLSHIPRPAEAGLKLRRAFLWHSLGVCWHTLPGHRGPGGRDISAGGSPRQPHCTDEAPGVLRCPDSVQRIKTPAIWVWEPALGTAALEDTAQTHAERRWEEESPSPPRPLPQAWRDTEPLLRPTVGPGAAALPSGFMPDLTSGLGIVGTRPPSAAGSQPPGWSAVQSREHRPRHPPPQRTAPVTHFQRRNRQQVT